MARATMTDLITQVRELIADGGAPSDVTFQDDEVQRVLDRNRVEIRYCSVYGLETIGPGGAVSYGIFDIGPGWESSVSFVDSGYNVVTPDPIQSDSTTGRFVFVPPIDNGYLMVTGFQYDIYAAAADLCESWISKMKGMYSFTRGSRSYQRGQVVNSITAMRNNFRQRQRVGVGTMIRTDII